MKKVKAHSQAILAPRDKVYERASLNCLEFEVSPGRVELLQKWIRKKYRVSKTYDERQGLSSAISQRSQSAVTENCRLKVERVSKGSSKQTDARIGRRNALGQLNQSLSGTKTSSILIGKGFNGTIRVDQETVFLTCLGRASSGYQISVSLDSPSSALSTSIFVGAGSKVNIGQVVEKLNNKRSSVGVPSGVNIQKSRGQMTHDYFLIAQ